MQLHRLLNAHDTCFTTLPVDAPLGEAVIAMTRYGKTAVAVMEGDRLSGIVTRGDLLACLGKETPVPGDDRRTGLRRSRRIPGAGA